MMPKANAVKDEDGKGIQVFSIGHAGVILEGEKVT